MGTLSGILAAAAIILAIAARSILVYSYRTYLIYERIKYIGVRTDKADKEYNRLKKEYDELPTYNQMMLRVWVWRMWKFNKYEVQRKKFGK